MKKIIRLVAAAVCVGLVAVPVALGDNDPFPAAKAAQVFLAAQTATPDGAMSSSFAPGSTVVFRAYAVNAKSHAAITKARYFYVAIPNQPTVKLAYTPGAAGTSGPYTWMGSWKVPADYPAGIVAFKVLLRTPANERGYFVQMPVTSAMLTIAAKPQTPPAAGPAATAAPAGNADLGIYVDTVNGTRPAGAAPRPIGCTQTNVYHRGEQLVVRTWGFALASGDLLTNDTVSEAHFAVPGQPNVVLNWGAHGTVGSKVFFWANAWNIPKDYPLGDVTLTVSYTTTAGKTGTFDYRLTIIP